MTWAPKATPREFKERKDMHLFSMTAGELHWFDALLRDIEAVGGVKAQTDTFLSIRAKVRRKLDYLALLTRTRRAQAQRRRNIRAAHQAWAEKRDVA